MSVNGEWLGRGRYMSRSERCGMGQAPADTGEKATSRETARTRQPAHVTVAPPFGAGRARDAQRRTTAPLPAPRHNASAAIHDGGNDRA